MSSEPFAPDSSKTAPNWPFLAASIVLALAALASVGWLFSPPAAGLAWQGQAFYVTIGVILLIASAWTYVWPTRLRLLTQPLQDLPAAFMDVRSQLTDIQAIRKEYFKVRSEIEGFSALVQASLEKSESTAQRALDLIAERHQAQEAAIADRKRLQDEAMSLRQAVGEAKREGEEWQKAALRFAEVIERTGDPESGLSEAYLQAATKFAKDFDRTFQPLGLSLIRPAIGDPFDATVHEAGGYAETLSAKAGDVAVCQSWGHMTRARGVAVKARVLIAKAPPPVVVLSSRAADVSVLDESAPTDPGLVVLTDAEQ
jgi:molecular chaperone GrpE (heat shock protein)